MSGSSDVIARNCPQWHSAILSILRSKSGLLRQLAIVSLAAGGVEPLDPLLAQAQSGTCKTAARPAMGRFREGTLGSERVERFFFCMRRLSWGLVPGSTRRHTETPQENFS